MHLTSWMNIVLQFKLPIISHLIMKVYSTYFLVHDILLIYFKKYFIGVCILYYYEKLSYMNFEGKHQSYFREKNSLSFPIYIFWTTISLSIYSVIFIYY